MAKIFENKQNNKQTKEKECDFGVKKLCENILKCFCLDGEGGEGEEEKLLSGRGADNSADNDDIYAEFGEEMENDLYYNINIVPMRGKVKIYSC